VAFLIPFVIILSGARNVSFFFALTVKPTERFLAPLGMTT